MTQDKSSSVPVEPRPVTRRKAIAAAAVGNIFEWYDFAIFILFAPYIASAFFPGDGEVAGLIKAFLAFGVGFIARPVGAVLLGYYGDRVGRKAALTLTFGLMALGTLVIGLAPTHDQIGAWAAVLILVGRLLQGLSAGGEIGGATAFLVEYAPPGRKGRYAAWLQASMAISNIVGALVALIIRFSLSEAEIAAWGWRIPFLFGLLIVPVGLWLRATLADTPEYLADQAARPQRAPILPALKAHRANIMRGVGLSVLSGVGAYALVIYMPVHLQTVLGFSSSEAFTAALLGNLMLAGMCFVSGSILDRLGGRRVLLLSAAALLVGTPTLMGVIQLFHSFPVLLICNILFCALFGLYAGGMPAALAGLFPTHIRSTAVSISYNIAITLFAGFAPAIVTWLSASGFGAQGPSLYVAAAALAALVAITTLPRSASHAG